MECLLWMIMLFGGGSNNKTHTQTPTHQHATAADAHALMPTPFSTWLYRTMDPEGLEFNQHNHTESTGWSHPPPTPPSPHPFIFTGKLILVFFFLRRQNIDGKKTRAVSDRLRASLEFIQSSHVFEQTEKLQVLVLVQQDPELYNTHSHALLWLAGGSVTLPSVMWLSSVTLVHFEFDFSSSNNSFVWTKTNKPRSEYQREHSWILSSSAEGIKKVICRKNTDFKHGRLLTWPYEGHDCDGGPAASSRRGHNRCHHLINRNVIWPDTGQKMIERALSSSAADDVVVTTRCLCWFELPFITVQSRNFSHWTKHEAWNCPRSVWFNFSRSLKGFIYTHTHTRRLHIKANCEFILLYIESSCSLCLQAWVPSDFMSFLLCITEHHLLHRRRRTEFV